MQNGLTKLNLNIFFVLITFLISTALCFSQDKVEFANRNTISIIKSFMDETNRGVVIENPENFIYLSRNRNVIGVCYLKPRPLYPKTQTIEFYPENINEHMAEKLYSKLQESNPNKTYRIFVNKNDYRKQQIAESLGFVPFRTTYIGKVDLLNVNKSIFFESYNKVVERGFKVLMLDSTPERGDLISLSNAHLKYYNSTHQINPPDLERPAAFWNEMFLGEDLVTEGMFYIIDKNDNIVSFSSIRNPIGRPKEWGWFGSLPEKVAIQDAELFNLALKYVEFGFAEKIGVSELYFEIDSTDWQAFQLLNHLPFEVEEIYLTYQTGIPNNNDN